MSIRNTKCLLNHGAQIRQFAYIVCYLSVQNWNLPEKAKYYFQINFRPGSGKKIAISK